MESPIAPDAYRQGYEAIREAARFLKATFFDNPGELSAIGKDIKTRADQETEALLRERLTPIGFPILGEEQLGLEQPEAGQPYWVIDPLDGTFNLTRGIPFSCICLALCQGHEPLLGFIFDLNRKQLYHTPPGKRSRKGDEAIRVSAVDDRSKAVLATGFPVGRSYETAALNGFIERVQDYKKIRMIGSAGMSLALVAEGKMDAYLEEGIFWWDVAAGLALVRASGGKYTLKPTEGWKVDVLAWNGNF